MNKMFRQSVQHKLCGTKFIAARRESSRGKWVLTMCVKCREMFHVFVPEKRHGK